jgi:hypothetical protein
MPYAELMQLHEYADSSSPYPPRPVMSILEHQMKAKKGEFRINVDKYLCRFINEDAFDRDKLFDYIGQWVVHKSYEVFGNAGFPYLAVRTNPTPLVDTGELRDNFAWKVSFRGTVHTL